MTWRKGLRWDKKLGGWVSVASGKLLTKVGLQRRKTMAKKGTLKIAKPRPKKKVKRTKKAKKPKPKKKAKKAKKAKPKDKREVVYDKIKTMLENAQYELSNIGYTSDVKLHRNRDGSLDSELRIIPRRGQSVNEIFIDMEQFVKAIPTTWISTGIRYRPRETEESGIPGDYRGLSRINSYYQKNTPRKLATNFVTAREINKRVSDKRFRKAENVLVKVHWNPKNNKPERDE